MTCLFDTVRERSSKYAFGLLLSSVRASDDIDCTSLSCALTGIILVITLYGLSTICDAD